jgi:hypothetical protein
MDHISGRRFQVNTGAALNIYLILPAFLLPAEANWLTYQLRGERHVELWLSGQHFKWTLFQSEIQMAT